MGLRSFFISPFARPQGFLGVLAARMMAVTNRPLNEFVVQLLDVRPTDHVLEIGFAHGKAIEMSAGLARQGFVAGVDLTETAIRIASRTNERFIRDGKVELKIGSVSAIPYEDGRFDKVCTVNTVYFWPRPNDDLREIRRVIKEGGRLVLAFRGKEGSPRFGPWGPALNRDDVEQLATRVRNAGFRDVRVETRRFPGRPTGVAIVAAR